jgi:hypothetical protein
MLLQSKRVRSSGVIAQILLTVISLFFTVHSPVMSSDVIQEEEITYCGLLHIPEDTQSPARPKPFLGIMMEPEEGGYTDACTSFIRLKGIVDGSPAKEADLRVNDIILSVNDIPVCECGEDVIAGFKKVIERQNVDSEIGIHVLRGGERLHFLVKLAERPSIEQPEAGHELMEICGDEASYMKKSLVKEDKLSLFQSVRSGLISQSNRVHNSEWFLKNRANPYQLDEFTYIIRRPLQTGVAAERISDEISAFSGEGQVRILDVINKLSILIDVDATVPECRLLTVKDLISLFERTNRNVDRAFRGLSDEDEKLLRETVLNPWSRERWNEILLIAEKIELKEVLEALFPLISCLTEDNLSTLRRSILTSDEDKPEIPVRGIATSFGQVLIGGLESDTYTEDVALILDPGGNDVYLNNAGGSRKKIPLAMVIDWEGNDLYVAKENFSQGAGVLGGGFLIDLGGNNVFKAMKGAQGAGFYGIGVLYNRGNESTFLSGTHSQGVGQFGIGLLLNRDENTLYQSPGYGQALGFFNGSGTLFDMGGNDYYLLGGSIPDFRDPVRATVSMGQGFGKGVRPDKNLNGVSGGMGILIDRDGDDVYVADYFAQGSSYYYGTGILDDNSGDDQYYSGRYSQGAGIHSSVGIFMERDGDDIYYASHGVAQGMGHDYGTGFFEDKGGDDRYYGGVLSQGAATYGGLGILLDRRGSDVYTARGESQAFADDEACMGIMFDLNPDNDRVSGHSDIRSLRIGTGK